MHKAARFFILCTVGLLSCGFSLNSSAIDDIDFSLEQGGSIAGTVTDESAGPGSPGLSSLTVYAIDAATGKFAGSDTTDAVGAYEINGLAAVNHLLYVQSGLGLTFGPGGIQQKRFAGQYYPGTYDRNLAGAIAVVAGSTINADVALGAGGAVTGSVIRADNNAPIQLVPIFLSLSSQSDSDFLSQISFFFGTTDANGEFTIEGVPPGQYFAWTGQTSELANEYFGNVYQRGSAASVDVVDAMTTENINFDLAEGGSISGTVIRQSDSQPLEDVSVVATAADSQSSELVAGSNQTDGNGNYLVQGLPPGDFYVGVDFTFSAEQQYASEYYPGVYRLMDAAEQTVSSGSSATSIDFSIETGGIIRGTVRRNDTMQPMQGITVAVAPSNDMVSDKIVNPLSHFTQTDAGGSYVIEGLPPGSYHVGATPSADLGGSPPQAMYPEYFAPQLYDGAYELGSAIAVNVTSNTETSGIDFELEIGGLIRGRVTRADNDTPLSGISVTAGTGFDSISSDNALLEYLLFAREVETSADGIYQVTGVPPGNALVFVSDDSDAFLGEVYDNQSSLETGTPLAVTLGDISTGTLSGTLLADSGGSAANGLLVEVFETSTMQLAGSAISAANGSYSVGGLFPGSYQVRVNGGEMYVTEFYDDAESIVDAATVSMLLGEDVTGIDFGLASIGNSDAGALVSGLLMLLLDD